ncbi:MAG: DUF1822 family protein [Cyanobacteria bacterium SIG30]|nr:DUF1822 family protein [Cyanobacteria bacterium SIG30]
MQKLFEKFFSKPKTQDEIYDEYAKNISSKLSSPGLRKKTYADIMGILAILGYLKDQGFNCRVNRSLHQIPSILEEFSVTDIYYNNYRIDVITNYSTNITRIPKCHIDYDIMADFYIIIKMAPNLKDFRILGYVKPDDIIMSYHDEKYYYPDKRFPIKDLFNVMTTERKSLPELVGKHADCESLFLRFVDKELSYSYKKSFIQHLTTCESCTKSFKDFERIHENLIDVAQFPYISQVFYNKITSSNPVLYKKVKFIPKSKHQTINLDSKISRFADKILAFIDNFRNIAWDEKMQEISSRTKKEEIELIFKDKLGFDLDNLAKLFEQKKVTFLIGVIIIILGSFVFGLVALGSKGDKIPFNENVITQTDETYEQEQNESSDFYDYSLTNSEQTLTDGNIEYSPIDYKGRETFGDAEIIKKISWEVSSEISKDKEYSNFLQLVGKNIKVKLENDLLLAPEIPKNKNIKVDIQFSGETSVMGLKMVNGSGSTVIDDAIERNVFQAFTYMQPPKAKSKNLIFTLVIEL